MKLKRLKKPVEASLADCEHSFDERVFLVLNQIIQEAEQLQEKETKELWLDAVQTFARDGDIDALLYACEWRRRVVPIDEFMFSSTYLGMDEPEIFPAVMDACVELDSDSYVEGVLTGAIGTGKSTISNVMLARSIYKLSCMRHPQTTLGIQSKSSIVFTIQSIRFNTAKKAIFEELGHYVNPSPYFQKVFPYDKKVVSRMMFREHKIDIMPVSSSTTGAISMNVLGGILDEMNFMQKIEKSKSSHADMDGTFDQAKALYNNLARRRRSRFTKKGKLPGILFLVSSSRFPDDFTEEKAKESFSEGGKDDQIFVYRHSQWSAKPRNQFLDEEFRVQVGNDRIRSKVLVEGEQPMPGCNVISVPMDFYNEFEKDVDGSLRDYAGITILAVSPFFGRRDVIYECMVNGEENCYQNPYNLEEVDLTIGLPKPNPDKLRLDIPSFRACHVDLGLNKDACGVAVGHVAGTKIVERKNEETGRTELEILPVIGIDLVLRIVPPPNGEIEFSKIRDLLFRLRDFYGLDIKYVTYDGFQSVDSRQILRQHGFQTDYHSVEKIETYRAFRDAMYDHRVLIPKHNYLAKELAELEVVVKNNTEKVDHRVNGTKDVADAVCGVVSFLLKRRAAWANLSISRRVGFHLLGNKVKTEEDIQPLMPVGKVSNRRKIDRKRINRRKLIRV